MYSNINAPVIPNPVMLDRVIGEIQQGLADNLPWLDAAFGRAQRLTKKMNGNTIITPNVYCGGWNGHGDNDYIEVSPDSKIGNFSFFEIDDPETIDGGPWARDIQCPFSLVFWFDLTRIYGMADNRNIEYIKAEILRVLNGRTGWTLSQGRITVNQIYERVENIYRGYSLSEIDNQFLMHPYAGLRITGVLQFMELCFDEPTPPTPPTPPQPDIPVVPADALQFDASRFAIGKVGNGTIFRIRGNSVKEEGQIINTLLTGWDVHGYNQINPADTTIEAISGGYLQRTRPFRVIPGMEYVTYSNDAFEGQTSDYRVYVSNDGQSFSQFIYVTPGQPFQLSEQVVAIYLTRRFTSGVYGNNWIVALYDGEAAGNPAYYVKTIALNITQIGGYDADGRIIGLFPKGLLSVGETRDEIYSNGTAVRKIGIRNYQLGDESNPNCLTDGEITYFPLVNPEVFELAGTIDFTFASERGGTMFQTPETMPVLLDIIIE